MPSASVSQYIVVEKASSPSIGRISASNSKSVIPSALNQSATTNFPPGFSNISALWKKSFLSGKWLIASEIQIASKVALFGSLVKKSPIFSASSSMNLTSPLFSFSGADPSSIITWPAPASMAVKSLAILTCCPLIVTPVTLHAFLAARYRVVPPIPQPTSRTLFPGGSLEMSSRSSMSRIWAISFESSGWRK